MNTLIIVLVIVILLLAYFIWSYLSKPPSVAKNLYLNSEPLPVIEASTIAESPYSANYAVGTWIYINTFSTSGQPFLTYGNSANSTYTPGTGTYPASNPWLFALRMHPTEPAMFADIAVGTTIPETVTSIPISNNFPIQSWVYVVVSVSSYYVDIYLNGKLVTSKQLTIPAISNNAEDPPTFSFSKSDIYVTLLNRWSAPLDPQTVWTNYNKGNGNPTSKDDAYRFTATLSQGTNKYPYEVF